MASTIEVKTLKDIQEELKKANIQYARVKEQSEKLNEKFTPAVLAGMQDQKMAAQIQGAQQELMKSVKAMADSLKNREADREIAIGAGRIVGPGDGLTDKIATYLESGFYTALTKFFGVDFRAEFFRRFDDFKTGLKKVGEGFKNLGKALGLGKAKDLATGIFDFLKNALILGFSVVGFASFLQGWSNAEKFFGENPDFGERLSSALAKVLKNFGIIEDEAATAVQINQKVKEIQGIVNREIAAMKQTAEAIGPELSKSFEGLKTAIVGAQRGEPGTLIGGLSDLATGIFNITKELIFGESLLGNIAGIIIMFKVFKAMIAVGTAVGTIGAGILTSIAAAGGLAAVTASVGLMAGIIGAVVGIVAAFGAHDDAVKRSQQMFDQSNKTFGDKLLSYAVYVDEIIRQAGNAIVEALTLGFITGEDMDRYNRITGQFLSDAFDAIVDWFSSTISSLTGGFFNEENIAKRKAEQQAAKIARQRKIIDIDESGTINSYDELNKAISLNEDMDYMERTRARLASNQARDQGIGFQQFIQNSSNPTFNNIVTSFGPTPGGSTQSLL